MSTTVNHNEFGPPPDGSGRGQIDESLTADLAGNESGGGLADKRATPGESAIGQHKGTCHGIGRDSAEKTLFPRWWYGDIIPTMLEAIWEIPPLTVLGR